MYRREVITVISILLIINRPVFSNQDYKYYENGAVFKSYSEINDYLDISKKIDEMSLTVQELERNITKYSER